MLTVSDLMVSFPSIFNLLPNALGSLFSLCTVFSYIISSGISLITQPWLEFSPEKLGLNTLGHIISHFYSKFSCLLIFQVPVETTKYKLHEEKGHICCPLLSWSLREQVFFFFEKNISVSYLFTEGKNIAKWSAIIHVDCRKMRIFEIHGKIIWNN